MILFQWVVIPVLAVLCLAEAARLLGGRGSRLAVGLRLAVWVLAIAAVGDPALLTRLANLLGVQRGADLVLYVLAFAFVAATFYLYGRYTQLQRQLTLVVRHLAIGQARQAAGEAPPPEAV